jgi:hypothetical protein
LRSTSLFASDGSGTKTGTLDRSATTLRGLETRATRDGGSTLDITQAALGAHLGLSKRTLRVGLASLEERTCAC